VDYAQLIDHGRAHIEQYYRRPLLERCLRALIPAVLTRPRRLGAALALGRFVQPFRGLLPGPLGALLRLVPGKARALATAPAIHSPEGAPRGRVALLQGCVEPAMAPSIRDATIRLITRAGFEVVLVEGEGCCGALSEHLGRAREARAFAAANVRAWTAAGPFDAIVTTAAGCGTALKGYGHLLRGDPEASSMASRSRDVLEFVAEVGLPPTTRRPGLVVAYHAPCSLQHGQQIKAAPRALLMEAGFEVREPVEAHLCCGSAGVYNILQPELATRLRDRKADNLRRTGADVVAAGNVGCIAQMAPALAAPVIHPVELLDWATGGPRPTGLGLDPAARTRRRRR
jgi:glycolate oxidase iron-sulfur subunit